MAPKYRSRTLIGQVARDAAAHRVGLFAEAEPVTPAPVDLSTLTDDDLNARYATARERGQALAAKPAAEFSAEELAEFNQLAEDVTALNTEIHTREIRAEHFATTAAQFNALPDRTPAPAAEAVTPAAAEPVAPAAAPAVPEVPSVTAMAQGAPVAPEVPATPARTGDTFAIRLNSDAAGVLDRKVGEEATVLDLTKAALKVFGQFGRAGGGAGQRTRRALGQFSRNRGEALTLPGNESGDYNTVKHARDQRRLSGGSLMKTWTDSVKGLAEGQLESLTAAAGWCAPSETDYSICSLWDLDGIFDAPTVSAPRGGINYTNDVSWAAINDAAITSYTRLTEAQVIAGTTKNCTELPCPEFTDRRLDVAVTCITGSFLQSQGYPEVVSTWTDGLLTRHGYSINEDIIGQVVTQAGTAIVLPGQGAVAPGSTPDTSATAAILAGIEIAAIDMRERENMSFGQTLEVVLPRWVLAQFRADISRRNAWYADPFTLTEQTVVSWFAARNVRPQFVRGWQDAQSGLAGGPGDIVAPITPITSLPSTVNFLIYPAGSVVVAREDVVTLTNVYDSTNLSQNLYTALFTEEAFAPIFPCGELRQYTVNACPSGATGAQVYTSCAAPAAAA